MRKWLLVGALAVGLLAPLAASAQTAFTMPPPAGVFVGGYQVVATCGTGALTPGQVAFGTIDTTGAFCSSGGGGGGGTQQVVGNVASGAADSGNPVKMGGIFESAPAAVTNGQRSNIHTTANGILMTSLSNAAGNTNVSVTGAGADSASNTLNGINSSAYTQVYNGSTWDRMRSGSLGDGGAVTGTVASMNYLITSGNTAARARQIEAANSGGTGTAAVAIAPTSATGAGITSVVSPSAEAGRVLKASAGNLYSVYATNLTATAGFLVVVNSTTVPADGAVTPTECVPLPANGNASINYNPGPAAVHSTGISAFITSATTCFTKTTGVITGFIRGSVQ